MDNYTKMCDHPLIQGKWKRPKVGDWVWDKEGGKGKNFIGLPVRSVDYNEPVSIYFLKRFVKFKDH